MKALQKVSKFLSDYTSIVVIAIAVVTFLVPNLMAWVNQMLFVDPVSNKFTCQSIIIGIIMFSMGLTLTTQDFKILAQRPFDICVGAIAQYLIMPFLAFGISKALNLPDGIALGLILVGCCPGGVSSNIMSYLCGGDVAFSVGMTTVSTLLSPFMTPLLVSFLASGTHVSITQLPAWKEKGICRGSEGHAGYCGAWPGIRCRWCCIITGLKVLYIRSSNFCGSSVT